MDDSSYDIPCPYSFPSSEEMTIISENAILEKKYKKFDIIKKIVENAANSGRKSVKIKIRFDSELQQECMEILSEKNYKVETFAVISRKLIVMEWVNVSLLMWKISWE